MVPAEAGRPPLQSLLARISQMKVASLCYRALQRTGVVFILQAMADTMLMAITQAMDFWKGK